MTLVVKARNLEFHVSDRCNLRCRDCVVFSPHFRGEDGGGLDAFEEMLDRLVGRVRFEWLRLIGGEPLISKELPEIIRRGRASGLSERIVMVTNGTLLNRLTDEIISDLDAIELSWYLNARMAPTKAQVEELQARCDTLGTALSVFPCTYFTTQYLGPGCTSTATTRRIFDECADVGYGCHRYKNGTIYRCTRVPAIDQYLTQAGIPHDFSNDGVVIDSESPDYGKKLHEYLSRSEPMEACRFCLGTSGVWRKHAEMTAEEAKNVEERFGEFPNELLNFNQPWWRRYLSSVRYGFSWLRFHPNRWTGISTLFKTVVSPNYIHLSPIDRARPSWEEAKVEPRKHPRLNIVSDEAELLLQAKRQRLTGSTNAAGDEGGVPQAAQVETGGNQLPIDQNVSN